MASKKTVRVTQVGSPIRRQKDQRATLVGLGLNGNSRNHIPKLNHSRFLRNNGNTVWVPCGDLTALTNFLTVFHGNDRTDHDLVRLELKPVLVADRNTSILVQHHEVSIRIFDNSKIYVMKNPLST